ncbi:cell wall-binding protein [Clostridium sp. MF28]|uniref:N-acetylmuramoyl-L-alanine amidase family protein n=1 Tax=Clostridium TaxID=1485 RepID=UPI000CFA270A|nr:MULTISPECIES: N-acetylmuramoyl-L-alanine amidase family protein [Clostridium]AVK48697.1 cell wall-binding protein [Clostridium sp. MF28]PSM57475.1 cell wall-binding protein [Clostridium diolis]
MFKRANKITSLLVAAASVMALVPAYAADVKKVDSEDGTVYNAVAYKDGKFFVDGEINDDEEAYYVADGKFNKLDDVDSGDEAVLFGEKYLDVSDGDYTVDLDKGSVTDDDVKGDTADDAAAALRKKIKDDTDDRYLESEAEGVKNEDDLAIIGGAKYDKPWYATTYTASAKAIGDVNGLTATNNKFNVYTDTNGAYIDADYNLGKVKVTTTADGATKEVTVENTNDTYDAAGSSDSGKDKVSASVKQTAVLTQDKDNIYRLVEVTVKTGHGVITEINGVKIADIGANTVFGGTNTEVTFPAIQKISKAQASDDVDGAKYAKTVTTYALSDDSGNKLDEQSLFVKTDGTAVTTTKYTVANGKLIAYNTDINDNKKVTVDAYTLKTKGGYYYADEEDKSEEDCEVSAQDKTTAAVQTDVDGNLWRLDGGYIYKFDNTDDWDKVYKVDGSFDELSVYDKDNMVAWSEDDDVYSLIGGKSDDNKGDDQGTTPVVKAGWAQTSAGWTYVKADGTKATGWLQDGGAWYYLKADGTMATGWIQDGATWYYLNGSGAMQTGWLNDNGTFYYLNGSGAMLSNTTTPDGYYVGANGAWVK